MKTIILAVSMTAIILSGCARRPDSISATTIPMAAYSSDSCSALRQSLSAEKENLGALSKQQIDAANADAFGVFLLGVPVSSLSGGDKEGDISNAKGKINAMEAAMHKKGCKGA